MKYEKCFKHETNYHWNAEENVNKLLKMHQDVVLLFLYPLIINL